MGAYATQERQQTQSALLGFTARIKGLDHPSAIFKLTGSDDYCWSCQEPSNGHLIVLDSLPLDKSVPLSEGKNFRSVTEHHFSYHFDGNRHRAVKSLGMDVV